jgi:hypothetical protein
VNTDQPVRSSEARAAAELALVRVVHHYGEKPGFVLLGGLVPQLLCSHSAFRHAGTFAALNCPQRGEAGAVVANSQGKVYLVDPLLAWLPSRLRAGLAEPEMTTLTEMALGVTLARAVDALDEGRWVAGDTIGYIRTASGREVDLAPVPVPSPSGPVRSVPIESKWVDAGWRSESCRSQVRRRDSSHQVAA